MRGPARVAVFASGGGTNLQALLDHFNARRSGIARVELVIGSRRGIGALERAERAGVRTGVIDPMVLDPQGVEAATLAEVERQAIDLIILAGYLKLIPASLVERYRGRMLNIHPALLPTFGGPGMYGRRVHEAVLAAGVRVSGATVHLVDERYDKGGIVAQWPVPVYPRDTPETLAARVLRVEHLLLPVAVERLLAERTQATADSDRSFELVDRVAPTEESVRCFLV